MRLLLLAGTSEARALSQTLHEAGADVLTSIAGRAAAQYPGKVRTGGFGGAAALEEFLRSGGFGGIVDATHPFAATISPSAKAAAEAVGARYWRLERPPWEPNGVSWHEVDTLAEAAQWLLPGGPVFLAVGAGGVSPFLGRRDVSFVLRAIEEPDIGAHPSVTVVRGRGPFSLKDERALWDTFDFTALVTKNAGGAATAAKLTVAQERGTAVVMVRRPAGQPVPDAATVEAMAKILAPHL